jgi:hypothetical protein
MNPRQCVLGAVRAAKLVGPSLLLALFLLQAGSAEAQGFVIQIDARALSANQLTLISGNQAIATLSTQSVQSLGLPSGSYFLVSGGPDVDPRVPFTVTNAGTVDFDASLNGILAGRGTSTLLVRGAHIQVDATALSAPSVYVEPYGFFPTQTVISLTALPGGQAIISGGPDTSDLVLFSVTNAGTVDFDASLNGILAGRGTSTLLVQGAHIHVDARALSASSVYVEPFGFFPTQTVISLTALPGGQAVISGGPATTDLVLFSVTNAGTVDFDASLDGILAGRGTATLLVQGAHIEIDATALSPSTSSFFLDGIGSLSTSTLQPITTLSGTQRFVTSSFLFFFFVGLNGTLDYDTLLDNVLLGRGTTTLVVLGDPGNPPSCLDRVSSLRAAVDALSSPMKQGLLAIVDQLAGGMSAGNTKKAQALVHAFVNVVDGGMTAGQIDPVIGQLLVERANLIRTLCLGQP